MQKTTKATKKRGNKYNDAALDEIQGRYGFSKNYIRKSIRGERTGKMAEILAREYNKLAKASEKALKASIEDLGAPEKPAA